MGEVWLCPVDSVFYSPEEFLRMCTLSYFSQETGIEIGQGDSLHEMSKPIFWEK